MANPHSSTDFSELVDLLSQVLELPIAPEYRPGVVANLERTAAIAHLVMDFPLPDDVEIAPSFQP
ncbi:MAG: hypothetical protein Kow00121_65910 [Elainellaceae cyanobacterium]